MTLWGSSIPDPSPLAVDASLKDALVIKSILVLHVRSVAAKVTTEVGQEIIAAPGKRYVF